MRREAPVIPTVSERLTGVSLSGRGLLMFNPFNNSLLLHNQRHQALYPSSVADRFFFSLCN